MSPPPGSKSPSQVSASAAAASGSESSTQCTSAPARARLSTYFDCAVVSSGSVLIRGMAMVTDITSILSTSGYNKNPEPSVLGFVAERWGFEPQNAFDTLHDFQSCALDQLSHLSTSSVLSASGRGPQRSTIIPERRSFVKHFFKKVCIFSKMTQLRWLKMKRRRRPP